MSARQSQTDHMHILSTFAAFTSIANIVPRPPQSGQIRSAMLDASSARDSQPLTLRQVSAPEEAMEPHVADPKRRSLGCQSSNLAGIRTSSSGDLPSFVWVSGS